MFASRIRDSEACTLTAIVWACEMAKLNRFIAAPTRPWTVPRVPIAVWIDEMAVAALAWLVMFWVLTPRPCASTAVVSANET